MPITFACECGKPFSVADEYAGKRTKCPGCGTALTVPVPADPEGLSEEDKAFRALAEAPDSVPARAPVTSGAWSEDGAAAPPKPRQPIAGAAPAVKRGPKVDWSAPERRERSSGTSGIHLTPAVWGGLLSMLIGGGWFLLIWSNGGFSIYGPILFIGGLVSVVRGLLGYSEE